jgi:hypothetical protein
VEEGFGQSVHVGFIRLFSVRKRHGIIREERGGGPVLHNNQRQCLVHTQKNIQIQPKKLVCFFLLLLSNS